MLGIAFAWLFRLNKIVTLVGVFVTNPWTIIPIYTFGTWVGTKIIATDHTIPDVDWSNITILGFIGELRPFIMPFIIGTTVTGLVTAVIGYIIIFMAVKAGRG